MGQGQNPLQWYPGHMAKAGRQIGEKLKLIDVVIELVDARVPKAGRNPDIKRTTARKKHVLVLNKSDLADPDETARWLSHLEKTGAADKVLAFTAYNAKAKEALIRAVESLNHKGKAAQKCLICGIPNVGKSAVINTLIGKKKAVTGNRPGVTKGQQWLKTDGGLLLLDTPGILWPKFDDERTGVELAWIAAIKDTIYEPENIAGDLVRFLLDYYPERLSDRYAIDASRMKAFEVFDAVADKKKLVLRGGEPDYLRTSQMILKDFRDGKLGRMTIDRCADEH
ncbi:MAG: ribosome biogenesis GTPase YlqF [Eubacteriaceae bacterium]|nr:ribosome biogenesis GTPase YlqF [Eubacteriaceae bacterium]